MIEWETQGPDEAQEIIEVFFRTPESLEGDLVEVRRAAESAGLVFTNVAGQAQE